jgi:two-component system, NtrC family, sensor kinase
MEALLRRVITGVSNTYGTDFFNAISLQLASIIGADYVFIARLDKQRYSSRTIALVAKGELQENFEYSLENTPCADVADTSVCCFPKNVCSLFPEDVLLQDMKIEAYLGTSFKNSAGEVMGLIAAMYEHPIENTQSTLTLFEIFSGRVAAEVERVEYEQKLMDFNANLEHTIAERTQSLQCTLDTLKDTQAQLIKAEKLAALGSLVAGIAHEVNTPLGIAITANSLMTDYLTSLNQKLDADALTLDEMQSFRQQLRDALELQENHLERARNLIENFKRTSADQHHSQRERVRFGPYYKQIISTLLPLTKKQQVDIRLTIPDDLECDTYPGDHVQILSNLIANSVTHGLGDTQEPEISISMERLPTPPERYRVCYRDNGKGLNQESRQKIFDPFFTTARAKGCTGLGMSILYNLVHQRLGGQVELLDGPGFGLSYSFAALVPEKPGS